MPLIIGLNTYRMLSLHFPLLNDGIVFRRQSGNSSRSIFPPRELVQVLPDHDFTLASLLKAVWALTLSAYTGMDQVCFGYLGGSKDVPSKGSMMPSDRSSICSSVDDMEDMKKNSVISVIRQCKTSFSRACHITCFASKDTRTQ